MSALGCEAFLAGIANDVRAAQPILLLDFDGKPSAIIPLHRISVLDRWRPVPQPIFKKQKQSSSTGTKSNRRPGRATRAIPAGPSRFISQLSAGKRQGREM